MENVPTKDLYRMNAEFWKTVANPKRLKILNLLRGGEKHVGLLAGKMNVRSTMDHSPRTISIGHSRAFGRH